jgi:iron complex outermembrane recepter protein
VNKGVQEGGRLAVLWAPTKDLTVKLSALEQTLNYDGVASVTVALPSLSTDLGLANTSILPAPYHQRLGVYNGDIEWKIDDLTVTSSTSYSQTRTTSGNGLLLAPGLLADISNHNSLNKTSQELRLTSPTGGRLEWMVGGFYTDEVYRFEQSAGALTPAGQPIAALNPLLDATQPSTYREFAVFGNATYHLNDQLDLTGGLRWSQDRQRFSQDNSGYLFNPAVPTAVTTISTTATESVVNYMATARYHFTPDDMVYARVASGYRPGGPNVAFPGVAATFNSDSLTNYEVGLKSELLEHRVLLDLAVFYIDWRNIQVSFQTPTDVPYLVNAGSAVSKGVEFSGVVKPAQGLSLAANFAYTDASLSDTIAGLGAHAGDRVPYVARWSGSLLVSYEVPLTSKYKALFNLGDRLTAARYTLFPSSPSAIRLPGYGALDASAGVTDGRWTMRLYAKNLNDARGFQTDLGPASAGQENLSIIQPRTVGLSLEAAF